MTSHLTGDTFHTQTHLNLASTAKNITKGHFYSTPCFVLYSKAFEVILGPSPERVVVEKRQQKFAHEAGVYVASTSRNYFNANYQDGGAVDIYEVDCATLQVQKLDISQRGLANADGGCSYEGRILFCAQGSLDYPSALTAIDPSKSACEVLLDNLHGR